MGVSIKPGHTALTRMPWVAYSKAASTVLWISALVVMLAGASILNRHIYSISGVRHLFYLPVYELVAVPILFGKGFFSIQSNGVGDAIVLVDMGSFRR